MSCMVSVIIPTFNRRALAMEAIRRVLAQSLDDLELIVVDDGSTDDTSSAVQAVEDARLRYFYKHNGGVASARNFGLNKAQGVFVSLLDSDDLWLEDHLKLMVGALQKNHEYGVAYTAMNQSYPDGRTIEGYRSEHYVSGWVTRKLFQKFFLNCQGSVIRRCVLVRRVQRDSLSQQAGVNRVDLDTARMLERFYYKLGGGEVIPRQTP